HTPPLYLRERAEPLRIEHLADQKTTYFWFGAVQNSPHKSFKDTVNEVFESIEKNGDENLVIDMRFNGGGNTGLIRPLIQGLIKNDRINQRGHLWVIIGRNTFSAAQNT